MDWTNNEILLQPSPHHPPKAIFQAVCDELGAYFKNKGFRYARSRPKLTYKDKHIKLEINFWSSGSNMAGEYVNLEILPYFYAQELSKSSHKGLLFGHLALFTEQYTDDPKKIRVQQIYGDQLEQLDPKSKESVIKYNNNCNLYGIKEEELNKIIQFIEQRILPWIEGLQQEEGIQQFLTEATAQRRNQLGLDRKTAKSCFKEYIQLNFPQLEL